MKILKNKTGKKNLKHLKIALKDEKRKNEILHTALKTWILRAKKLEKNLEKCSLENKNGML